MVCEFVFGPNQQHFFCSPNKWEWNSKVPVGLSWIFARQKVGRVLSLVLGPNDAYFILYEKRKEEKSYEIAQNGLPQLLVDWLYQTDSDGYSARDYETVQVSLAADGVGFFAFDSKGSRYDSVPASMDKWLRENKDEAGRYKFWFRSVSLGYGDNWCAILKDSGSWMAAVDHYDQLIETLRAGANGELWQVWLDPHSNRYAFMSRSGYCSGRVFPDDNKHFKKIADDTQDFVAKAQAAQLKAQNNGGLDQKTLHAWMGAWANNMEFFLQSLAGV